EHGRILTPRLWRRPEWLWVGICGESGLRKLIEIRTSSPRLRVGAHKAGSDIPISSLACSLSTSLQTGWLLRVSLRTLSPGLRNGEASQKTPRTMSGAGALLPEKRTLTNISQS